MRFVPVPEPRRNELIKAGYLEVDKTTGEERKLRDDPTAEEWAKALGIEASYDLPSPAGEDSTEKKHSDLAIQTLLFPYELESRLRSVRSKARTAIEETGANILYLSLGFLEWIEKPYGTADAKTRLAPLFLIPVQLEKERLNRKTGTYDYTIAYSGEDLLPNLSLREKLKVDFGLALPTLEEATSPEQYFDEVKRLLSRNQPRWKVRRLATLALLNFSKLLMYLDLDPKNWPSGAGLQEHPTVARLLGYQKEEEETSDSPVGYSEEHEIDSIPNIHASYPLVEDADSSQHSALIDAIEGTNLVVEGPPGTGKSQTITNLIAAAMVRGKRVLFVAEKLAALEVVKRRLDAAGLGDFCLELHSHKTQKRNLLGEIQNRLSKHGRYRKPRDIDAEIERVEALKLDLRRHAELVNQSWRQTGETSHEILMAATRHRLSLDLDPSKVHPSGLDGDTLNPSLRRRARDSAQLLSNVAQDLVEQLPPGQQEFKSHPWSGVENADLQLFDFPKVEEALREWQSSIEHLESALQSISAEGKLDRSDLPNTVRDLQALREDLAGFPEVQGDEHFEALRELGETALKQLGRSLKEYDEIEALTEQLGRELPLELIDDGQRRHTLLAASRQLLEHCSSDTTLDDVSECASAIESLQREIESIADQISDVTRAIGQDLSQVVNASEEGLEHFQKFLELARSLRPKLWQLRSERLDSDESDDELARLQSRISKLRDQKKALEERFDLTRIPDSNRLAELQRQIERRDLLRWLSGDWHAARKDLVALASSGGPTVRSLRPHLPTLVKFDRGCQELDRDSFLNAVLPGQERALEAPLEDLFELRKWYRQVRSTFGLGFGRTAPVGDVLLRLRPDQAGALRRLAEGNVPRMIASASSRLGEIRARLGKPASPEERQLSLAGPDGALARLHLQLKEALAGLEAIVPPGTKLGRVAALASDAEKATKAVASWSGPKTDSDYFGGTIGLRLTQGRMPSSTVHALRHTEALARGTATLASQVFRDLIRDNPSRESCEFVLKARNALDSCLAEETHAFEKLQDLTELRDDDWRQGGDPDLTEILTRSRATLEKSDWLGTWVDYLRIRQSMSADGFQKLLDCLESGAVPPSKVEQAYALGVYDLLAREILKKNPGLARFRGRNQETIQQQYREYDLKLKRLQAKKIAWQLDKSEVPQGNSSGRVSSYTDRTLLEHECEKKKRHLPIRKLLERAGDALIALKPCFMMGPMSVAQYLAPGKLNFDLVVMDEASQIKPEDALGAIARGTQIVVVGDSKQLPPTSFFDRLLADDQDDPSAAEDAESILDAARPLFPSRRLRWHYRSQHEALIAFSNYSFYDGNLVLFPSPHADSPDYGVQLHRVARGRFLNRRNIEEARSIAEAVQRHLKARPEETIGVVAMNVDQREQIERFVEEFAKDDPDLQAALERDQEQAESLFVKNLENVQGDERDVVLISMTYGPQEVGGPVLQRFGPINSDVGWRRLNVLFTRARKRMHVFTSMGPEDIRVEPTSSKGIRALQGFLSYADTGRLDSPAEETDREPANDFEEAVAKALKLEGFESTPQVGAAGFYIDIAVRDPGNPGRFLMGIECDGATYHSAKSVRDRDRLRQAVLERLGWRMRRIWSTDWFVDPQGELAPILDELRKLATAPREIEPPPEAAEILEVVEHIEAEEESAATISQKGATLENRLLELDRLLIRPALPETPEPKRLLRPAMLDALVAHRPVSKSEFLELIPGYLRQETAAAEAKFLPQVFDIIITDEPSHAS